MSDQELKQLNEKVDRLMNSRSSNNTKMNFLLTAAMPVAIAITGVYFTTQSNQRQIEFQQIQVANQMVVDVQSDPDFTKEKLDLKLSFVESMFENKKFKAKVKDILSQTYAVSLTSMDLGQLAQSGDAEDVKYVQNKIAEAKKFDDTSINKVVNQLEQKESIRRITKTEPVKDSKTENLSKDSDSLKLRRSPKNAKEDSLKTDQKKKPERGKAKK